MRLFEVGSVFELAEVPDEDGPTAVETERLCVVFAGDGRRRLVGRGHLAHGGRRLGSAGVGDGAGPPRRSPPPGDPRVPLGRAAVRPTGRRRAVSGACLGVVGELDPTFVETFGLVGADGRPRRVGWLDLDLGALLDPALVPRRPLEATPVSRFPSSDIDLAFVVPEEVPAGSGRGHPGPRSGATCSSRSQLFDVYRGDTLVRRDRAAWPTACGSAPSTGP